MGDPKSLPPSPARPPHSFPLPPSKGMSILIKDLTCTMRMYLFFENDKGEEGVIPTLGYITLK
jgi:hypothetical protein